MLSSLLKNAKEALAKGQGQLTKRDDLERAAFFAIDAAGVGDLDEAEVDTARRALNAKFGTVFSSNDIGAAITKAVQAYEAGKFSFGTKVKDLGAQTETDDERRFLIGIMLDVASASDEIDEVEMKRIKLRAVQMRVSLDEFGI